MAENRLTVPMNPARALRELNRQPAPEPAAAPVVSFEPLAETPSDEHIFDTLPDDVNNTTILQSDKPTDKQTDRPTNNLTSRQTNQPTITPTDNLTDRPTNKPSDRLSDKPSVKRTARPAAAVTKAEKSQGAEAEPAPRPRVDGRTMRARQETADKTMVTSLRLAVPTIEALDEYCWKNRQRKQDVVQAALDMYFAATEADE